MRWVVLTSRSCSSPTGRNRPRKVAGIAVHTGARVAALAEPGDVLVSATVRDLVSGSGIEFDDRGEHELKGVGTRRIFAVATA